MSPALKRFYKEVSVAPRDGGFAVLLDGRAVKTPARSELRLATENLAEAIAAEWRSQTDKIVPDSMPLTKLAYTAIDRVAPLRDDVIEQIAAFGRTDLLCYRAAEPSDLAQRQQTKWEPLLTWVNERFGVKLNCGEGIAFVEQPGASLATLRSVIAAMDDFRLAGVHNAATLTSSVVVALALADGLFDAHEAFAIAELEATYQAEIWGEDWEAKERSDRRRNELIATAQFLQLLRP